MCAYGVVCDNFNVNSICDFRGYWLLISLESMCATENLLDLYID